MGESISTKKDLIRLFLKYPINSIPVVDENRAIIGFISKQDIIASSQTTGNMNIPIEEIINIHLNPFSSDNLQVLGLLIKNYNKTKRLPVIDKLGNIVGMWEKYEFISAWGGDSEKERKGIYSSLFDNLLLGIVITSHSKIVYINQFASSLSNVRGKKLGRDFYDVFGVKFEHFPSRLKKDGLIFDAGYIKENGNIKGTIYIIAKEQE